MNRYMLASVSLLAVIAAGGCTTTKVTARESDIGNERIPRPAHIIVYNFAATPAEIAAAAPEVAQYGEAAAQTAQEIEVGRKLGAQVAKELVSEINNMGLSAASGTVAAPGLGDLVIKGYFDSVNEGSTAKRVMLGFGSGSANLRTQVIAYQQTARGLRRLGSGAVDAGGGGKTPGLLLPIAVVAATANPIGLVVGGAVKVAGETSGHDTIEGAGKRTAKEIAAQLEIAFEKQGWIH